MSNETCCDLPPMTGLIYTKNCIFGERESSECLHSSCTTWPKWGEARLSDYWFVKATNGPSSGLSLIPRNGMATPRAPHRDIERMSF